MTSQHSSCRTEICFLNGFATSRAESMEGEGEVLSPGQEDPENLPPAT